MSGEEDCLGNLVDLESRFQQEGELEGLEKGKINGYYQGFEIGLERGEQIGSEIGTYLGSTLAWSVIVNQDPSKYTRYYQDLNQSLLFRRQSLNQPQRAQKKIEQLKKLIGEFKFDPEIPDFDEKLDTIRNLFKVLNNIMGGQHKIISNDLSF